MKDFHEALLWLKGFEILKGEYTFQELKAELARRNSDLSILFQKYRPANRA